MYILFYLQPVSLYNTFIEYKTKFVTSRTNTSSIKLMCKSYLLYLFIVIDFHQVVRTKLMQYLNSKLGCHFLWHKLRSRTCVSNKWKSCFIYHEHKMTVKTAINLLIIE